MISNAWETCFLTWYVDNLSFLFNISFIHTYIPTEVHRTALELKINVKVKIKQINAKYP